MCVRSLDEHPDFQNPALSRYLPSERRAILVHRYFLGIEQGADPGLAVAIQSWEAGVADDWRRKKMHLDRLAQMTEIDRHRSELSTARGRSVDWNEAVWDWVQHHAEEWRQGWERTVAAGA